GERTAAFAVGGAARTGPLAGATALAECRPRGIRRRTPRRAQPFRGGANRRTHETDQPTELIVMALTLSTNPGSKLRERTIVSACLQARAPLSYEIRDADDRRLAPTLAGYKLRRGGTYCLKVRTQDKAVHGWSLRVLVSRSTADPPGPDEIAGDAR